MTTVADTFCIVKIGMPASNAVASKRRSDPIGNRSRRPLVVVIARRFPESSHRGRHTRAVTEQGDPAVAVSGEARGAQICTVAVVGNDVICRNAKQGCGR